MPRYYFDLISSAGGRGRDAEGIDFDNLEAAKQDALQSLGAMAAVDLRKHDGFDTRIEIREEPNGLPVCVVSLSTGADC